MISGANICGGNPRYERPDNEYYATDPMAVEKLLSVYEISGANILEPCVGGGNIAKVLEGHGKIVTGVDITDRGYPGTIVCDFLKWNTDDRYDAVITNPPFSLATQFIEKGMKLSDLVIMFLKIQFLEGQKRKEFFKKYPPSYVYVFSKRVIMWTNGSPINPKTQKPWQSTMCFAWFVWDKKYTGDPIIRWL